MSAPLELSRINLNLLLALDALLREASVSRAAGRLGVSQPAMSQSLRQLRELLADPLLVRSGGRMALTPRAEKLAVPLRRCLVELEHVLQGDGGFEPARSRRRFSVAMPDFTIGVLPGLLEHLGRAAPGASIDARPFDVHRYPGLLETGELDLAVSSSYDPAAGGLRTQTLYTESFVCVARRGHPGVETVEASSSAVPPVRGRITLECYLALAHALISPSGAGTSVVDRALAAAGRRRRVALRVPYFLAAPLVVARSDLVLTSPARVAREFLGTHALDLYEPPIELSGFDVLVVWHPRYEMDPAHRWFRDLLIACASR